MKIFPYPEVVGIYTIYRLLPVFRAKVILLIYCSIKKFY